ncbi:MAG: pantothenate kinase, partial [Kiritimatiellae bacterium]|nr:pantothenate kinase [Kiritimatiellia bacterium]
GAMLFGIDAGFCGVVRETVDRLMPQVGAGANLIATGGFAPRFIPKLRLNFTIDPDLTLRGIGLLAATAD